jgi:hypothetical protein
MRHGWRMVVLILVGAAVLSAGCNRGGKKKPAAGTSETNGTRPGPSGGPPSPDQKPPEVKPGDIAGKARVTFGFYREKGPLTPKVTWNKSEGRLSITQVHSAVNTGPDVNTRVESKTISADAVGGLLARYVDATLNQIPEVKVLEVHITFKGKDAGRVVAKRQEMEKAVAAANAAKPKVSSGERWHDVVLANLPDAWISPSLH